VTVTITFGDENALESLRVIDPSANKWKERQDWRVKVFITVDTLLRVEND